MYDLIRDSLLGQCLRFISGARLAQYPEERLDFQLPDKWEEKLETHTPSEPLIVDWYSHDDGENPHNWSQSKKAWVSFVIMYYTLAVYIGASLYSVSEQDVTRIFGVSDVVASLGLSLYVVGYSVAPLVLSPLSEIPAIGRTLPYGITFTIFVILCVPLALVNNLAGLFILRFLLGVFGSPALATAGASYGDFYGPAAMPYVLAAWGGWATVGPALGPVVGGFAVQAETWRWSSWELLWLSGPALILMLVSLPETSADLILLRRARRLRKLTGRKGLQSESELRQANLSGPGKIAFEALIKPAEINFKDPAVLFSTVYTALIYGIYYSFFESFPLVYEGIYHWNLEQTGLAFLAVLVGLFVAVVAYCSYFYFIGDVEMARLEAQEPGSVPPELRLKPGLVATLFIPVGLFLFAWTARSSVPFIVSLIGVAISMAGIFIIVQCMFVYLPFTYPRYSGSLFAANGFARGMFAAVAILFSRPMFLRLGVDGGVSLLAGLTVLCVPGIYVLYIYGHSMRKKSRFAVS